MGFITRIEQSLEKAVRGTFSKGGSGFEPVDLANRIRTEMDNKSYAIASGRTLAPNVFTLSFADADFPRVQDWGAPLAEELCDVAIRHARAQGYSLRGSVRVTFSVNDDVTPGDFEMHSVQEKVASPADRNRAQQPAAQPTHGSRPASAIPAADPAPRRVKQTAFDDAPQQRDELPNRITKPARRAPRAPRPASYAGQPGSQAAAAHNPTRVMGRPQPQVVLEINGHNYSVQSLPVVLGRGANADITVDDTGVSRLHLEIIEQDGVYLAVDLGSTNGSYLNGQRLHGRQEIRNGAVLTMGRARIVFRLMVPRSDR